jgi:hypothetical protein
MGKTEGDGKRAPRMREHASAGEMQKVSEKASKKGECAASSQEAENLRKELATERQRVQELEKANASAAERLDAAIETVKAILDKQG